VLLINVITNFIINNMGILQCAFFSAVSSMLVIVYFKLHKFENIHDMFFTTNLIFSLVLAILILL